jgi:AcrR family transcriptional regulator
MATQGSEKRRAGGTRPDLTETAKKLFLENLRKTGNVTKSAKSAGMSRTHIYYYRRADVDFERAWDDAIEQRIDDLEENASQRAIDGWQEEVYQNGKLVGHKTRYSDAVTIFMLKKLRAQKFRDSVEITGAEGGPMRVEHLTDEQLMKIIKRGARAELELDDDGEKDGEHEPG